MNRLWRLLTPVLFGAAFIGAWEGFVRLFDIKKFLLPRPSAIWTAFGDNLDQIREAARITGTNAVYGLIVGVLLGVAAALLCSRFRFVNDTVTPLASAVNSMPIIAVAPVFNIWFGTTNSFSRRAVVILVVFFPVFVNVAKGLTQVDATQLELMRSYAAPERDVLRRVRIPNALPFLMSALRLAASLAVIAAIVAEYFGGTQGSLGQVITQSAGLSRYDKAWAAVLAASAIGLGLFGIALLLERIVLPWQRAAHERT